MVLIKGEIVANYLIATQTSMDQFSQVCTIVLLQVLSHHCKWFWKSNLKLLKLVGHLFFRRVTSTILLIYEICRVTINFICSLCLNKKFLPFSSQVQDESMHMGYSLKPVLNIQEFLLGLRKYYYRLLQSQRCLNSLNST